MRIIMTSLFLALLLAGCAQEQSANQKQLEIASRNLVPADETLKEIYLRSCRSCHTIAATGAPLTGDSATWGARIEEKGMDLLIDNVINGFGGMPPFGLCMDCDAQQFEGLILFMAGEE